MFDLTLYKMDPGELIGLVSVIGAYSCGIVGIIMVVGLKIRRVELASALKKDMLQRGMTAEEIRIVMEAGSNHSKRPKHPCKSPIEAEV